MIRFEVANFRSILDPVELSMVAVDRDRDAARPAPNLGESLLPVAGIYGPNASGKSNVLAAMEWLRNAVGQSLRFWDDRIPVEPFAFSAGRDRPAEFTMELLVDRVRFEYVVELDQSRVLYEGLFHYPEKKRRRIFEREGKELKLQRGFGVLAGTRELLTDRVLALSIARRFDHPLVTAFAEGILSGRTVFPGGVVSFDSFGGGQTSHWFSDITVHAASSSPFEVELSKYLSNRRPRALALLRMADLGIDDVEFDDEDTVEGGRGTGARQGTVRFVHGTRGERVLLDFAAESEGTRTWFRLIGPVLTALGQGSLLLFDELDASLHPTLSAELIRLFQDPKTNPAGAQLVFSSHDTSLLNHLNRDEVWLTEKDTGGATRLGALAEFAGERVRRSQNLEKAYLGGRFGALPDVDRTDMLRALGLIG